MRAHGEAGARQVNVTVRLPARALAKPPRPLTGVANQLKENDIQEDAEHEEILEQPETAVADANHLGGRVCAARKR